MTAIEERPTISERYSSATESSNLKVNGPDKRDSADIIIAAGWLADSLGALLLRLRREFETASGDLERARRFATARFDAAQEQHGRARKERLQEAFGPTRARLYTEAAAELEGEARRTMVTEHALALMRMKSLRETKEVLGKFAVQQATKQRFMRPDAVVLMLAGRVLDVHLDPLCHHCGGRGFNGGAFRSDKTVLCRPCAGTGHRKENIGQSHHEHWFTRFLLAEMDRVLARAAGGMAVALRTRTEPA
jgi:hypothetical protein